MQIRIITALSAFIAINVATATTVRAQSAADADHAMLAIDLRMRALNTASKNLRQIEQRRDDHEADAVRDISDADANVFSAALKVFTVAFILTGMKCPDDVRFTQKQFEFVADSFVTTADSELSRVNEDLRSVATPAALAEAATIRDVIVDLRDFLKPFTLEK